LDVVSDVETLAELIAAKGTEPPLAIALLGEWGSGKSSVMRQVEARVDALIGRGRTLRTDRLGLLKEKRDACAKGLERIEDALRDGSSRDTAIGPVRITRPDTRARAAAALLPCLWRDARGNLGFLVVWLALSSLAIGVWTAYHAWLVGALAALVALVAPVRALWREARLNGGGTSNVANSTALRRS
jgi:hypothetical protein